MKRMTGVLLAGLVVGLLAGCGGSGGPTGRPDGGPEVQPDGAELTLETAGAAWVAFQDGAGAWRVLDVGERHTVAVRSAGGRYGVAHVCLDEADEVAATLLYATLAERAEAPTPCSAEDEAETYTLSGAVSGLAEGAVGHVYGASQVDVVADNAYGLAGLAKGEYNLLATVRGDASSPPRGVLIAENVSVEADELFDLELGNAAPTTLKTLTVEGAARGDELVSIVSLVMGDTSAELGSFFSAEAQGAEAAYEYAALPRSAGAVYRLLVERFSVDEASGEDLFSSLERTLTDPKDLTLRVPAPVEAEVRAADGRPDVTWREYGADAGYSAAYYAELETLSEESETRYTVSLSDAWLSGAESEGTYTLPDFRALPGWKGAWELSAELFWSFAAQAEREDEVVVSRRSGTTAP